MRGEFIDVNGARLYYYAAGSRGVGEPVVFLHGFPTSSHLWTEVVPLVPKGHRVVVVDLLGYGRSDRPAGRDVSVRGHADRIIGLLDALAINYACIVGHDVGGGIAQTMAVRWPTRVSRLMLGGAGFDCGGERVLSRRAAHGLLHVFRPEPGSRHDCWQWRATRADAA